VKVVEVAMMALFTALGIRSLLHWGRRPFDGVDVRDHVLFALFVTGRVGLWFGLAGLFLLYALTHTRGRAFIDDVRSYDWFVLVFVGLAALQLLAGDVLGPRSERGPEDPFA
jgi:H+/Cl- antiporter ClcA